MAHWASIVFAPLVYLANLSLVYALVPLACQTQREAPLHVANGLALLLTLAALALAWRARRRSAAHLAARNAERNRFLSTIGVFMSALCALAIAAQWSTQWMLAPCFA